MPGDPADTDAGAHDPHLVERWLGSETRLEGGFLTVRRDRVALPDGGTATREFVLHPGAVAVVPILDDGRIAMVRQFRYPVGRVLVELPAGKLDPDEPVLACAIRELKEETGFTAREWARAGGFHNAAAYSSEVIEIWFARGLVAGEQRLDDGEFLDVVPMTEAEIEALAVRNELPDMKTMIGLQWLQQWRAGRWALDWRPAP